MLPLGAQTGEGKTAQKSCPGLPRGPLSCCISGRLYIVMQNDPLTLHLIRGSCSQDRLWPSFGLGLALGLTQRSPPPWCVLSQPAHLPREGQLPPERFPSLSSGAEAEEPPVPRGFPGQQRRTNHPRPLLSCADLSHPHKTKKSIPDFSCSCWPGKVPLKQLLATSPSLPTEGPSGGSSPSPGSRSAGKEKVP